MSGYYTGSFKAVFQISLYRLEIELEIEIEIEIYRELDIPYPQLPLTQNLWDSNKRDID